MSRKIYNTFFLITWFSVNLSLLVGNSPGTMLNKMMYESLLTKNMNNLMNLYEPKARDCLFQQSPCNLLFQNKNTLYKGEFFFAEFPGKKREFWMLLNLDSDNHIYSVSRDSVGPFVCVGKKFSENSAKFYQKYFDDYEIYFECFYFSNDSIEGNWTTTNAKGHFVLKRDASFSLEKTVVDSLGDMLILLRHPPDTETLAKSLKLLDGSMLGEVEEFKPFLEKSILAVMINGAQGGMPSKKNDKEFEEVERLFEQYKNTNLLSDLDDEEGDLVSGNSDDSFDVDLKEFNTNTSESIVISTKSIFCVL